MELIENQFAVVWSGVALLEGGGGLLDYSVGPSPIPFPLDFGIWILDLDLGPGFETWIWDLDLGPGFGTWIWDWTWA